jgi:hypothetical protein
LLVVVDYFNDYVRARSLAFAAQIKIMEKSSLVFLGYERFGFYLRLLQEKLQDCVMKKKEFKILEKLLVSFILYFIIVESVGISLPCTIYYSTI